MKTGGVATLLYTGSLAESFVNRDMFVHGFPDSHIASSSSSSTICSGLDNSYYDTKYSIILRLTYFRSLIDNNALFTVDAFIFGKSPLKLVIGSQSIRE